MRTESSRLKHWFIKTSFNIDYSKDTLDDSYENEYEDDSYYDGHNEDSRIVGGFDAPDPIPWYVMLKIMTENGTKEGSICGGALINSRLGKKKNKKNEKSFKYSIV